ncbi:iron chelate uptake ABC transporter family permease subunit [Aerococcaceae bacterium zg-ZUI334]|uniref:iron chelate uptake ABC transporter family permease subunit n=1 Tax=Aerococcaceae bacterium zg-252 TaxID=2796928 RepID=UPI001B8DD307|nr:iron chelate uptake ABC transporter family permease subunit [Aerococcaceae bacterium zg-ZUI334]
MKPIYLWLCLLIMIVTSILTGAQPLEWNTNGQLTELSWKVLWYSRIPRTISIVLAGSSMSVAGMLMQAISQNRFAAPSTVGTIESAKFGLLMSLWIFPQVTLQQKLMSSFIFAVLLTGLFFFVLVKIKVKQVWTIPLFGMIYGQIIGSIASAIAYRFDLVQSMSSWQQGNFSLIQVGSYEWLWLTLILLSLIWVIRRPLTIMQLGEVASLNLGIAYQRMKWLVIAGVCLICAVNVMIVGTLPFIGVIIPNLVRMTFSDSMQQSLPIVMLSGSLFVLICDILARTLIAPYELPVSLLITFIGGIFFLSMLFSRRGATSA